MKIKQGVNLLGIRNETNVGMMVAEAVLAEYGQELVITSAVDGRHKRASAHASGRAFDVRIWTLQADNTETEATQSLQVALGSEFDVVEESDHIHIEWDPKKGVNQD